jgi:short-subunit dehydrogenase
MGSLTDQIAVITGASSGIGKAIALTLARHGAKLVLIDRDAKNLDEIRSKILGESGLVSIYRADLGVDEDMSELINHLKQDLRHVDMLVHSAGVISHGTIERAPVEDFDKQYRINVRAPYILTQALLPEMRLCKGQIVFINSSAGLNARAKVGQYAATKHALRAIADSLREEENANGLRILSVFLGRTATPMQSMVYEMEGRKYKPELLLQPEDVAEAVVGALCSPRTAEITDIKLRPANKFE